MMNMNDVILKKRNGGKLTQEEIKYFVDGYTKGEIPDYQASALLMAIYFQKMDREETFQLTDAMLEEGSIQCPGCGETLEFDFDDDEEDEGEDK